jgi:hypothetical protein
VWVSLLGLVWGQYFAPRVIGGGELQAPLQGEPLSANPVSAFPYQRWCAQVGTALYGPAPELSFRLAGGSYSWDSLQMVSLLLQQWQFDKLSQWEVGGGYALRFLRGQVTLAVRGRWLSTFFSEYGRVQRFTPDVGFAARISPALRIGGYGYNLLAQGWGFLPGRMHYGIGVAYAPHPSAEVRTELLREGVFPLQVRTGFLYRPHPILTLRGGVGLPTLLVGAGFTLAYKKVGLDFGYRYQPSTGSWVGIGLSAP